MIDEEMDERKNLIPVYNADDITTPCFVALLLHDQAYGGPEEGGWYYATTQRLESHYCQTEHVRFVVLQSLRSRFTNEGRYPVSSVLSDGIYAIEIGLRPAVEYEPERKPHYE